MARSLANGPYTHEECVAKLRSGVARFEPRFDVLTRDIAGFHRASPSLDVSAATVSADVERQIITSLTMTMLADERLRLTPFRYYVEPWLRFGPMRDGGMAELSMGVYIWTKPKRMLSSTKGGREEWSVTLGDQLHLLDAGGPGDVVFQVNAGQGMDDGVTALLTRAGISDFSGVASTDEAFANTLQFSFERGARRKKRKRNGKVKWEEMEGDPETWLWIADDFHEDAGMLKPHFALDGTHAYQFRPAIDYSVVDPPAELQYDSSSQDGILLLGFETDPDLGPVANRVLASANNPENEQQVAFANLNDLLPQHPLAQRHIGFYIDRPVRATSASAYKTLGAIAQRELFDAISYYEKVAFESVANPAHTLFDAVTLRIDGDPEIGDEPGVYLEKGWSMDLFGGTMRHDARRLFRFL